jgi:hypothetical protein
MDETMRRICTQAMRELLLLQASDWQFLVTTWSARDYAEMRFTYHYSDFKRFSELADQYSAKKKISNEDDEYLSQAEDRNSIFPELRVEWWNDPLAAHVDYVHQPKTKKKVTVKVEAKAPAKTEVKAATPSKAKAAAEKSTAAKPAAKKAPTKKK